MGTSVNLTRSPLVMPQVKTVSFAHFQLTMSLRLVLSRHYLYIRGLEFQQTVLSQDMSWTLNPAMLHLYVEPHWTVHRHSLTSQVQQIWISILDHRIWQLDQAWSQSVSLVIQLLNHLSTNFPFQPGNHPFLTPSDVVGRCPP